MKILHADYNMRRLLALWITDVQGLSFINKKASIKGGFFKADIK
jgi:hypothetical protein